MRGLNVRDTREVRGRQVIASWPSPDRLRREASVIDRVTIGNSPENRGRVFHFGRAHTRPNYVGRAA